MAWRSAGFLCLEAQDTMTDLALRPGEPHRALQAERLDGTAHDLYKRTGENLYERLMRTGRKYGTIEVAK
jgi:hypothetical protein